MAVVGAGAADLVHRLGRRFGRRDSRRLGGLGISEIQVELERGGRVAALVTAALAVLLAVVLPVRFADVAAASLGVSRGAARSADEWQPYDAAEVAKLRLPGKPLLVNFTASWCLTCLVNERNAFADSAVQEIFRSKGVTLMKGDWTNRDPAITQALAAFGRAGVPLYVVYNSKPGSSEPVVLPQLLTAGIVQSTFAGSPDPPLLKIFAAKIFNEP